MKWQYSPTGCCSSSVCRWHQHFLEVLSLSLLEKKKLWKKQAFQRHLFMDCCYFFKLSVIRLSRMGGRLQWNIFSWDEVGRHSGENHYYHWGSESKVIWNISKTFGIKGCPPRSNWTFFQAFLPIFFLLQFNPTSEADLVHRHDGFVHCGFLLLLLPILHIHLKYQEKRSPGDMFWIPAGAHSGQLGRVVEEACQVIISQRNWIGQYSKDYYEQCILEWNSAVFHLFHKL